MNLRELTGYKGNEVYKTAKDIFTDTDTDDDSFDKHTTTRKQMKKFTDYLAKYGFYKLGSGIYGTVYEKAGYPWVFKLFKGDPAYLYFVKYAKLHQDNVHIPKIKGHTIQVTPDTYAIRTELLRKITPTEFAPLGEMVRYIYWKELSPFAQKKFDELIKVYPAIYEIFSDMLSAGFLLDVHEGNIMMRGNDIVLTDPIVARS
jgi:hypothetical protein